MGVPKCAKQRSCLTKYWESSEDVLPLPSSAVQPSALKLLNGLSKRGPLLEEQFSIPRPSGNEGQVD